VSETGIDMLIVKASLVFLYVKAVIIKRKKNTYLLLLRALKVMKSQSSASHLSKFEMVKGEIVIELEGTVTTQPVLQHVGVSTWPGKLNALIHKNVLVKPTFTDIWRQVIRNPTLCYLKV
jgi:MoaA/NifB/PqqE/SkfB family radical SAM enzyme